jgi:hypothetical protein
MPDYEKNESALLKEAHWSQQGACAPGRLEALPGQLEPSPDIFFAEEKSPETLAAKEICMSCHVRLKCLEYALEKDERWGVWGGLTTDERRAFQRKNGRMSARIIKQAS